MLTESHKNKGMDEKWVENFIVSIAYVIQNDDYDGWYCLCQQIG